MTDSKESISIFSMASKFLCLSICFFILFQHGSAAFRYDIALPKSLLYFEAQRSGKLPLNQRVSWRADSAFGDGSDVGLNLVGGYYQGGDNVKYSFLDAFSMTLLSWAAWEYEDRFAQWNELAHVQEAIRWGTDYMLRAHPEPNIFYGQVGEGDADAQCWQRPEDMMTPRRAFWIDTNHPGSDLAAKTAATLVAASNVFQKTDPPYASQLVNHSMQLFDFALNYQGSYTRSIEPALKYYTSAEYTDELIWAAAWLLLATNDFKYFKFLLVQAAFHATGGPRQSFNWDDKYAGAQVLITKMLLEGKFSDQVGLLDYFYNVEKFICSCIQKGSPSVPRTPGGLLYWHPGNTIHYVTSSMLLAVSYSDSLVVGKTDLNCTQGAVKPAEIIAFARSQVDYILGVNPKNMSYMVGFGTNFPQQVHHRGASIVLVKTDPTPVSCKEGYDKWYGRDEPNPNVLVDALVGGPNLDDSFNDARSNPQQTMPLMVTTAAMVGLLARLAWAGGYILP